MSKRENCVAVNGREYRGQATCTHTFIGMAFFGEVTKPARFPER
jgi:hypothetical protein